MITVLTGSNSHLLLAELQKLTQNFIAEHGDIALERLEADEASYERIQEALKSMPFLASKKMVVIKSPSSSKQFTEKAEEIFDQLPESTDLILVEPKLDKRLQFYKLLKKKTELKEFNELDSRALASWLVGRAKEQNGSLSLADAQYLVERVGANQQIVSNELDKLLIYNSKITKASIDLLTDAVPQSTIFELIEAAFAGNTKKALQLNLEQKAMGVEPQQVIAMLTWQLNVLAIIKTAGDKTADVVAKEAKLNPFVVRKSQNVARRLTLQEVKDHISALAKIDNQTKRTSLDIDEALQFYMLNLAK